MSKGFQAGPYVMCSVVHRHHDRYSHYVIALSGRSLSCVDAGGYPAGEKKWHYHHQVQQHGTGQGLALFNSIR